MITKLDNENSKQYRAICDFWRLGPGRSVNALLTQYKSQESAPSKTYSTLSKWYKRFEWESRIAQNIADEQQLLEEIYTEELLKNSRRRFELLNDMFELTQEIMIEADDVSVAQATGLYKAFFDSVGRVFNLDAPIKFSPTTPDGKSEYHPNTDLTSVLELLDLAREKS